MFGVSQSQGAMDMVMDRLAGLIPVRQVDCDNGKDLDIVLRETPGTGVRYLFLTNINSRETYTGTVRVGGPCREPLLDLTGDTPRPVPAFVRDGVTAFPLRLPPGRFAVIRCETAPGGRGRD